MIENETGKQLTPSLRANGSRECARPMTGSAKQSTGPRIETENGLLRRFAPRNDGKSDEIGGKAVNDITELTALNRDYINSVQNSDVKRFDEILAEDFYCSNPDKSLVDRAAFLKQTAIPLTIRNLEAHDVKIRLMGDFAIIHARTGYTTADGNQGSGRYTDVWARQNGRWLAVSAHVSR
jgi:ketosteroid isomerase-like protein